MQIVYLYNCYDGMCIKTTAEVHIEYNISNRPTFGQHIFKHNLFCIQKACRFVAKINFKRKK